MQPQTAALRMGDWKLLNNAGKLELYNLAEDIGEAHDLSADQPEKVKQLRAEMDQWLSAAVSSGAPAAAAKKKSARKKNS
jgi:arylsulfatase A-like enzyme